MRSPCPPDGRAHFSEEAVSHEHAQDALAFAEALLGLYVLRQRFAAFKQRLDGATQASAPV